MFNPNKDDKFSSRQEETGLSRPENWDNLQKAMPVYSSPLPRKRRSVWPSLILLFLVLGAFATLYVPELYYPNYWSDFLVRQNYQAPQDVQDMMQKIALTKRGQEIFLASAPSIDRAENFNQHCTDGVEQTVSILGCYDGQNIYIFQVDEPKLAGVMETTSAHELLHASYRRLNRFDKEYVTDLIDKAYEKLKDPGLERRLEYYRKVAPNSINDELHSILGTEYENLPTELEEYYARFFEDRTKIVAYFKQYNQPFKDLMTQAENLKKQIEELEAWARTTLESHESRSRTLNQRIAQFNQRASDGYYTTEAQFQADRRALLAEVSAFNQASSHYNQEIDRLNKMIQEYNSNVTQQSQLRNSLNSYSKKVEIEN